MKARKLWFATATAATAVAIAGGAVLAAWSASGSGSAAGRTITAQAVAVNAVTPGAAAAALYPGGPAGWVYFSIQNPNPYPITITHLAWGTPVSGDTANCPSSNFSVDANAPATVSLPIPASATSGAFQVFGVVDLAHAAPDGCQGVTVSVPLTVSGAQQ